MINLLLLFLGYFYETLSNCLGRRVSCLTLLFELILRMAVLYMT